MIITRYMTNNKRKTGAAYERKAGSYLQKCGYEILEYNYRCRLGEIDIIAKDGSYLVFCEVKYRSNRRMGTPAEAVTLKKQQTISKCAMYYVTTHGLSYLPCRFDVVSISDCPEKGTDTIDLIKNAFDYV